MNKVKPAPKMFSKLRSKVNQLGYTLVELSISLSIIALLAVGALAVMQKKNTADALRDTNKNIEVIQTAISSFVKKYGYLPCPADPTFVTSNANFGVANCSASGLVSGAGVVPVWNLKLSDDYAFDGWNRKFTYRLADNAGSAIGFNDVEYKGNIRIIDRNGNNKTQIDQIPPYNEGASYVLISYGANGNGAGWAKNSSSTTQIATGIESQNVDHSNKIYVQADLASDYDDIVVFASKKDFQPFRIIESPFKIDDLTCGNAHDIVEDGNPATAPAGVALKDFALAGYSTLANNLYFAAKKVNHMCANPPLSDDFFPSQISGLQVWLDASETATLFTDNNCLTRSTLNGTVGCWKDKSLNGIDVKQTGGLRPLMTNSLNGKQAVAFDGTDDKMTSTLNIFLNQSDFTVFVVSVVDDNTPNWMHFFDIGLQSDSGSLAVKARSGPVTYYVHGSALTNTESYFNAPYTYGTPGILEVKKTSTGVQILVNGASYGTAPLTSPPGTINNLPVHIGHSTAAEYLDGSIGEIILYNKVLTTNERTKVLNYLSKKWSIPVS